MIVIALSLHKHSVGDKLAVYSPFHVTFYNKAAIFGSLQENSAARFIHTVIYLPLFWVDDGILC